MGFFKSFSSSSSNSTSSTPRALNLIIVDESGSMSAIYDEALDGMNRTIDAIQETAQGDSSTEQYITLVTFDSSSYKMHLRHCPAARARKLTRDDYRPGACTPLYDAIGISLTRLEPHVTNNDAVFVTIITDGEENASRKFSGPQILNLINRLKEKGWLFTFIGANQDVIATAKSIGIDMHLQFETTAEGAKAMWEKENRARKNYYKRMKQFRQENPDATMSAFNDQECCSKEDFFERD